MSGQEENSRESDRKNNGENQTIRNSNSFRQDAVNYEKEKESYMFEERQNQIREQLSQMNFQLKYLDIKPVYNLCNCKDSQTNYIIEVIQTLISKHSKEKENTQGLMRQFIKSQAECKTKDQKIEQLQNQNDKLRRNKNIFQQKINNLQREYKQKEDKLVREKQVLLKEKRGWENHVHATTVQSIKKDNKILDLQKRLQKINEKGDKTQPRNTFQLMQECKQIPKQLYKTEVISMIEKNLTTQKKFYETNNSAFCDILKEVFSRLRNLMHILHETDADLFVNENVINIPHQHSQIYIKTMRKYLAIIQKRLSERSIVNYNKSNNEQAEDNTQLYNSLQQMHSYYNNWRELFQSQKNIVKKKIHFEERLNRIKNDDLHHVYEIMDEQTQFPLYEKCLKSVNELETSNAESDAAFRQKVKFIMHESNIMNLVDRKIDQSLMDDTEP